ncbi:Mannan endo-1,4-beta-mannosidase [Lachnellula occidentalis]|uniref:mannan endo-1,4-beta-mannosidase n=1 Tax=Lachnellula occidentalis TaxID=215460 RepID=A0A8H8S691_9HELO|nr:Mannan endo-1,4-beta-mannosidase [Lachnellula occidentalis]
MSIKYLLSLALALMVAASNVPSQASSDVQPIASAFSSILSHHAPLTPQILQTLLEPNKVNLARNSYVYREGTTLKLLGDKYTESGANVYWLGLDENVIPPEGEPFYAPLNASYPTPGRVTEAMATLVMMGARLIRSQTLGVSTGNPLSLMPSLGVYNEDAFKTIDWAVFQARQHGLRIMAPLTDDYDYYHGGKFNFLRWRGFNISGSDKPLPPDTMEFYTNETIISDFKDYIRHLLTHINQYTGLTYAEDPTIIGYETGNELNGIIWADKDVPNEWTKEICQYIKKLGPKKLCIDGTYGVNSTHFDVEEVDIFSNHYYPLNNTILEDDIARVEKANRVYLAGEIDWRGDSGDSLASFYNTILAKQNVSSPVVAGSLFWSLFGHNVPDCSRSRKAGLMTTQQEYVDHSDGLTLQYGNPKNTAQNNTQISTIRQHYFAMQGITVDSYLPAVACPHGYVPGYEAEYTYV